MGTKLNSLAAAITLRMASFVVPSGAVSKQMQSFSPMKRVMQPPCPFSKKGSLPQSLGVIQCSFVAEAMNPTTSLSHAARSTMWSARSKQR
jgi:hypothetical protein